MITMGILAAAMRIAAGGGGGGADLYWPQVSASLPLTADFSDVVGNAWTDSGVIISGGAAVFDGVNDYMRLSAGIAFAYGRSDFTLEGFTQELGSSSIQCVFDTRTASIEGVALYGRVTGFGGGIAYGTTGAIAAGTATLFSNSAREHWALVRDNGTIRFYLAGVQLFSVADARMISGAGAATIGDAYSGPGGQPASISTNHIRSTRGVCRYPGGTTFTPPVGPFDTSGGTDPGTGPGAHRYWRLRITASESASFHGMTELRLFDRDGVLVSGYNVSGGTGSISASSSINGANIDYQAFDGNLTSTGWLSATAGTEHVRQDMQHASSVIGVPVEIKDVHIYGSWNSPASSPKDFTLQWSDDDSIWTDALVVTGETGWGANELRTFPVF